MTHMSLLAMLVVFAESVYEFLSQIDSLRRTHICMVVRKVSPCSDERIKCNQVELICVSFKIKNYLIVVLFFSIL